MSAEIFAGEHWIDFDLAADQIESDKMHEECGVVGYITPNPDGQTGQRIFSALYELQHRGEEGAGIVAYEENGMRRGVKGPGLLRDVLVREGAEIDGISPDAKMGIGHTRYGTSGGSSPESFQPFGFDIASIAHNGNIHNAHQVAQLFNPDYNPELTDSAIIANLLHDVTKSTGDIHEALDKVLPYLEGSYCYVIADGTQLIAVRDPNGIRPLSLGRRTDDGAFVVASETPALRAVEATFVRNIEAGEILTISDEGLDSRFIDKPVKERFCAFEFVYTARRDGELLGRNVGLARRAMGRELALQAPAPENSIVIGMPDSGIDAACGFANAAGLIYEPGAVRKDRYTTKRSFQEPTKHQRESTARRKYQINPEFVKDQEVVVVDDSVVRGTTMREFVKKLHTAGAKKVHLRIPCPPIEFPCFMGVDIGNPVELIANQMDLAEMTAYFGADTLAFLNKERWERAIGLQVGRLCMACVDRNYPVPVSDELIDGTAVSLR